MTLTDNTCQKKKAGKELASIRYMLMHRYKDSKTT